jgi:hypothetical protein
VLEDDGTLFQKHFTRTAILDDRWWPLPLVISYGKGGEIAEKIVELGKDPITLSIESDWLRVNRDCTSLCRVWQKGRYFNSLLSAVREQVVTNTERWAVLVDYRALAQVGLVSSVDVLELLRSYENETDFLVIREITGALSTLYTLFEDSRAKIGAFTNDILSRLVINNERNDKVIKALIFVAGNEEWREYAKGLWSRFLVDDSSLDPNLRPLAFCIGVRDCDGFDELLALARTEENLEIRYEAIDALGFAPPDRTDEVLRIGLAAAHQDVTPYLTGVAANVESGRRMWDFVKENWATLNDMFRTMAFNIPDLIRSGTAALKTVEEAEETERWFAEHPLDIAKQPMHEAIEAIRSRAALIERDKQRVADYLSWIE